MTSILQDKSELRVFRQFAASAQLELVPESVHKRQPPQPDIECELTHYGRTFFELVEVVDGDFARLVSDQIRIQQSLGRQSFAQSLSALADALVFVRFVSSAGVRQREREIPALFEFLRSLPSAFSGDVKVPPQLTLANTVRSIRITRGNFVGPHFQVDAGSFISDPLLDRLAGKFRKRCETRDRIELLAFYDLHPIRPPEMWVPTVQEYVESNMSASQFCRAWIFDVGTKQVLFVSNLSPQRRHD